MRTRVLPSRPLITQRGFADGDGYSGRRFTEELQTDLQTNGNKTARLLDQVPGPRDVYHSLLACLRFFVDYSRELVLLKSFINVILDYI